MRDAPRPALWAAVGALVCGALLCVLGWYGISGERYAERQLPYLASCTVPGAALMVAGAVLLAAVLVRGGTAAEGVPGPVAHGRQERDGAVPFGSGAVSSASGAVAYGALAPGALASSDGPPLRVPGGTLAHRPDCPLVDGRPDAEEAAGADLTPCPVCEPSWPR
ncbi:hypothetical protein ACIQUQ_17990 [Streptomyces sp. NPDC101118]|uniref:hypothetical protein n=1 Tax=Streptomyces sp. NPDC101118 TaxID=3366109 RepID=UPI00381399AD